MEKDGSHPWNRGSSTCKENEYYLSNNYISRVVQLDSDIQDVQFMRSPAGDGNPYCLVHV